MAYALASIPIAFRNLVPEIILDLALAVLAASVLWLALWLVTLPTSANAQKDQAKDRTLTKQA